jgi:chromosome segregation ATPase
MAAEEELSYSVRMKVAEEDIRNLKAELSQVTKAIEQQGDVISASLEDSFGNIQGMVGKVASLVGVGFGIEQVKAFAQQVFNVRSKMQDLNSTMTTFLGSEEKAAKFTEELSNYAYWNMFEFDELAEASSELMAYGTKTEEIIGVLDQLSNVASGTKRSIGELTAMYNRAKSQGFLDSRQMLSLASMTGSTPQQLKELAGEADKAQLSFDGLTIALEKLTGEGGKFNNLMLNQMDNLSASYGQLQDNITNMMNEIGENLQDYFKGTIDFAGKMVENYEKIGIAIGTLIAIYGEYKAVLMVTNALQKASVYVEAGKKLADNIKLVMMFRKELGLLTAAQQAFNLKAMANPYVLLAGAVIGVTTAILGLAKATEDNRTESEKINDTYNDTVRGIEDQTRVAKKYLAILEDETASLQSQKEAREELNKMNLFKGQNEDGDVINKAFDKSVLTASIEDLKNYVNEAERIIKEGASVIRKEDYEMKKASKLNDIINADRLGSQKKEIDKAVKSYNELAEGQYKLREEEIRALPTIDAKTKAIEAEKEALFENDYVLINQINHLNAKKKLDNDEVKQLKALYTQYESNAAIMKHYDKLLQEINADRLEQEKGDVTLSELPKKLREQETKVEAARKKYAQTGKKQDKDEFEREKSSLDNMMKLYQAYTNKKWVLDKDYYKTVLELQKDNARAWEELENSKIKKKGELARKQLKIELASIDEQEREFRRNNNGRTSGTFSEQKNIVTANFEQKRDEAGHDILKNLNEVVKNNTFYASENERVLEDIKNQTKESLKSIEEEWENYASFFDNPDNIPTDKIEAYGKAIKSIETKGRLEENNFILTQQKSFIEQYMEQYRQFKEDIKNINENSSLSSDEKSRQIEQLAKIYNFDQGILSKLLVGVGGEEGLKSIIDEVMNTTLDEVLNKYYELDAEINALLQEKENNNGILDEEKQQQLQNLQLRISATQKRISQLKGEVGKVNKEFDKLKYAGEIFNEIRKGVSSVEDALGDEIPESVKNIISSIDNLTSSLLEALEKFSEVGDSVVDVVSKTTEGAETLVETSGEAMKTTSESVSRALQTIETASVILAIIGAVIKVINAIKDAVISQQKAQEESLAKAKKFKTEMQKIEFEKTLESSKNSNIFGSLYDPKSAEESLKKAKENIAENYQDIAKFNQKQAKDIAKHEKTMNVVRSIFNPIGNYVANAEDLKKDIATLGIGALFGPAGIAVAAIANTTRQIVDGTKEQNRALAEAKKSLEDYSKQIDLIQVKTKDKSGFAEFFGAKDEWSSLEDFAKKLGVELKDATTGEYNLDALKLISETYKDELGKAKDLIDAYVQAQEGLQQVIQAQNDYYEDIFGDLSTSIVDYFWDMYTGSEDAMEALEDSFGSMLIKMVKQSAITSIIQPMLDKLMADMKDENGLFKSEDEMTAILGDFFQNIDVMKDSVFTALDSIATVASQYGIDIKEGADKLATATAGGFESMSQDTAEELNGRFTALQIYGYELNQNVATISMDMKQVANIQSDIRYQLELNQDVMQDMMQNVREINANTSHLLQMKNDLATIKSRL